MKFRKSQMWMQVCTVVEPIIRFRGICENEIRVSDGGKTFPKVYFDYHFITSYFCKRKQPFGRVRVYGADAGFPAVGVGPSRGMRTGCSTTSGV